MIEHVAIIGAGFSGTLQAINLLRHKGPRATLIERAPVAGEGLAYGAAHPSHLLNVRAGNMSAFPDDPSHFVRWLTERGVADAATSFAARVTYGEYLRELLAVALLQNPDRLELRNGEVTHMAETAEGMAISFADGGEMKVDAAVLAVGNLPPHDPPGFDSDVLPADLYKGDPWDPTIADDLSDEDTVLIIGTGLTMVDVALMLEAKGFGGKIIALSRRGLLPRRHSDPTPPGKGLAERPASTASALVNSVRSRGESIGWRNAVDELRPHTQGLWANASKAERGRFLRHLRPWWDVHRHRLAPQIADRIDAMLSRGQLTMMAGSTLDAIVEEGSLRAHWRPRGEREGQTLTVRRVVNCTGPLGDLNRTTDPLLLALAEAGTIRPDDANIGIDVNSAGQTISASGRANQHLYALGPMTRGAFWEIVAVPDIRRQTWDVARRLSNAHWVGGEGL